MYTVLKALICTVLDRTGSVCIPNLIGIGKVFVMLKSSELQKTQEKKNLTIKGALKLFDVYRIPLSELRYNAQNGRIATWVSKHDSSGDLLNDKDEFNATIENYIYEAGKDTLNATKNNIERFGQQDPAVVISDGTLVDGNRRFTALRKLSREGKGQKFNYINAVLLPAEDYTPKEIKILELNLQHAKEDRVDYNPIDRLVDIYRDLVGPDKSFDVKEYAREIDETEKFVKDEMRVAQLLVDYLDYIHRPGEFFIAREQKIDGPLREVDKILKSKKLAKEDVPDAKDILFASLVSFTGDVTRKIRDMKKTIWDTQQLHRLADDMDETLNDIEDSFIQSETQTSDEMQSEMNVPKPVVDQVVDIVEHTVERTKLKANETNPLKDINKVLDLLENIDASAIRKLSGDDVKHMEQLVQLAGNDITRILEGLNAH